MYRYLNYLTTLLYPFERITDPLEIPELRLDEQGLYCFTNDIDEDRVMEAYPLGLFPWNPFRNKDAVYWYCPLQRFVIFPDNIHVSHSMRNLINRGTYSVSFNHAFEEVIKGCAFVDDRYSHEYAWLGEKLIGIFTNLHKLGWAKSVEVWKDGNLVGGLYGIYYRQVFIGDSMFSIEPSASKLALISLARKMAQTGGKFIDCQIKNPHVATMGGETITYQAYRHIMQS